MPREKANSGRRIQFLERRLQAMRLRKDGLTYDEIGREMGVSVSRARQLVREEFQRLKQECNETAEEALILALDQLDDLYAQLRPKVDLGDLKAADICHKLIQSKAKLLGLEVTKLEIKDTSRMTEDELLAEARRLGIHLPATVEALGHETGNERTEAVSDRPGGV